VCAPDARELGELGEEIAAKSLLRAGFSIAGRRVRTPHAEIDVLARDGGALVLVEVKTMRHEPVPGPRGALREPPQFKESGRFEVAQVLRLRRAADWLSRGSRTRARIDAVEVHLCARTRALRVVHRRDLEKDLPIGPFRPR
jgi:putative endonuclease